MKQTYSTSDTIHRPSETPGLTTEQRIRTKLNHKTINNMIHLLPHTQRLQMTLDDLIDHEYQQLKQQYNEGDFEPQTYSLNITHKKWNQQAEAIRQVRERLKLEIIGNDFTHRNSNQRLNYERQKPANARLSHRHQLELNILMAAQLLPKEIAAITIAHDLIQLEIEDAKDQQQLTQQQRQRRTLTQHTNRQQPKEKRRKKPGRNKGNRKK